VDFEPTSPSARSSRSNRKRLHPFLPPPRARPDGIASGSPGEARGDHRLAVPLETPRIKVGDYLWTCPVGVCVRAVEVPPSAILGFTEQTAP
jgi:hypothetical protein